MRIHIATDHAGLDLSHFLIRELTKQGHQVFDHGPATYEPLDDYPSFCINAALAVVADQQAGVEALGIVLGGSGNGEQIAANKVKGIRAALAWNESTAKLAREHNDANVIAVGARQHTEDEVLHLIELFVAEPFSNDERHVRRIGKISTYEQTGDIIE
jgi:ribose 5-phosphate isomerase B